MNRLMSGTLAVVALILGETQYAEAGTLIVSGDTNIVNALTGQYAPIPIDPGNQQFFNNVLSGGQEVVVQGPVGTGQTGWTSCRFFRDRG